MQSYAFWLQYSLVSPFCQRGECVGQTAIALHFGTFLVAKFTFAGYILVHLVEVYVAGGFIEKSCGKRRVWLSLRQ